MYYIKRHQEGIKVYDGKEERIVRKGLRQFLNELCVDELATLDARLYAIKKKYAMKQNIPIYIDESRCFYTTKAIREYNTICINYFNVLSLRETKDRQTEIIFKNLNILKVPYPYSQMVKKHMRTRHFIDSL